MRINAVTTIKSARESAVKNRQAAISSAAKPFDEEIAAYDTALKSLLAISPKPAAKAAPVKKAATAGPVPTAKPAPAKKAAPKIAPEKKAGPDKAAAPPAAVKKAVPKKAPAKKTAAKAPAKKAAPPKKAAAPKKVAPAKKTAPKKGTVAKTPAVPGIYSKDSTVAEKLASVIHEAKRFLNMQEVADHIKKHEPSLDLAEIKKRFSKHMDKFRTQGKIVSYAAEGKTYYGLPDYFKDGKAVKGHEHKA